MTHSPKQRVTIAAVALGSGLALLALAPRQSWLREAEGAFTGWLAGTAHKRPFVLTGSGGFDTPWTLLRDMAPSPPPAPPRFLAITDDPAGIFESNPPSAADWAVILANLHLQGHRSLAIAPVLAWNDPDPIAFAAVDSQLERFRPAIAGMPVVRGISPQPVPPAFLRFSLPVARVDGDYRTLPIVNQPAVANASLGRTRAVAAFTRLDSEQAPEFGDPLRPAVVPLLARWDDRIVFSLPLAATMVRFSVGPDDLTIRPGREIRLGPRGPVIPIDLHGRTKVEAVAEPLPAVAADSLIDPERKGEAFAPPDPAPLVVRDDRTRLTPDDREMSRRLADVLVALAAMPRGGNATVLSRPHTALEVGMLVALALAAAALAGLPKGLTRVGALAGLSVASVILLLVLARFQLWMPALATSVTPLAGALTAAVQVFAKRHAAAAAPVLTEIAAPPPASPPEPAPADSGKRVRKATPAAKTPREPVSRKSTKPVEVSPPPAPRKRARKAAPAAVPAPPPAPAAKATPKLASTRKSAAKQEPAVKKAARVAKPKSGPAAPGPPAKAPRRKPRDTRAQGMPES